MTEPRPPRLLTWILARAIPRTLREAVLGDLAESYQRRRQVEGPGAANRQYWREGWAVVRSLSSLSNEPTSLTPPRGPFDGFGTDLRFALRLHARRPATTALVLVTLGLAIGASTAIYSVVKPALLETLPYPYARRLVLIWEREAGGVNNVGYTTMADLRDQSKLIDRFAALSYWSPTLLGMSEPARLTGQKVSHTFFGMLGVVPALGRDFLPADDLPGGPRVAIISHKLWRQHFAADPATVGRTISLDGFPYVVIGILPDDFESLVTPGAEIWRPLGYDVSLPQACRDCRHLRALGRLAPGVSLAAASGEVNKIAARMLAEYPKIYGKEGMLVEPLKTNLTKGSRGALALLFAAVALVLAIACANVANLLLGQAVQRRHEFAVRMAVGSGRDRLIRQVLLESMMLGLAGAVVALALTALTLGAIRGAAADLPRSEAVGLDWGVLLFGAVTGLLAGVWFGLLPALSSVQSAAEGLRLGHRSTSRRGVRRVLVVAEVALASILVIGALLLSRSMGRFLAIDVGFRPEGLVTASVQPAGQTFVSDTATWRYYGAVRDAVREVPGVTRAALVSQLPLGGGMDGWGVRSESRLRQNPDDAVSADRFSVTPDYFETMGIPVLEGRVFTGADRAGSDYVVVVNATFARTQFPGKSALGERLRIGPDDSPWRTIVGVVGDVKLHALDQNPSAQFYNPFDQWIFSDGEMAVVARTDGDPAALGPAVRRAIRAVHSDPTIERIQPMTAVIGGVVHQRRTVLHLFQGFAALSLLLAAVGIYGVMASGVAERTRELGIRAALGASAAALRRSVLLESAALGGVGLAIGLVVAGVLARLLGSGLYGLEALDLPAYAAAAAALLVTMVAAAWIPALRAARLDPAVTLQAE